MGKPRNIIIYSDGTGQRGGVLFDEPRSNVYKLYRATRCGPESSIDPAAQTAFYDPGIGTEPVGRLWLWHKMRNVISQALGIGLTGNIIDCYAALVRHWHPGDRVFLIGFSRGAYTVRCLGGVIAQCGIPTVTNSGDKLKRDRASSTRIAREAVRTVYQHTHSRKREQATRRQLQLLDQRRERAERFREKYGSGDSAGSNAAPHFIGVFDTVASLANPGVLTGLVVVAAATCAGLSTALWVWWPYGGSFDNWLAWFFLLAFLTLAGGLLANLATRFRWEIGLNHSDWWRPFHFNEPRMRFYDMTLNPRVGFARHAIAIDEARGSFRRVPWGTPGVAREVTAGEPEWFQQLWFAGCHSDIGGSYPEEESRLSDIALQWMLEAASSVGLHHDPTVLKLYPDPTGPQHDETRGWIFRFAAKAPRSIPDDAPLHASVLDRFEAAEVLQYDLAGPYRPQALQQHIQTCTYYPTFQIDT